MTKLEGYDVRDIGVAWYTLETWRELRALPEAKIEKTYSEYVRGCERVIAGYTAQGFRVVKLPIDIGLMVEWCHAHGYEIDGKGRAVFGAALMTAHAAGKDIMTTPFSDDTRTMHAMNVPRNALDRLLDPPYILPTPWSRFMRASCAAKNARAGADSFGHSQTQIRPA
jgi:hypothetical protein